MHSGCADYRYCSLQVLLKAILFWRSAAQTAFVVCAASGFDMMTFIQYNSFPCYGFQQVHILAHSAIARNKYLAFSPSAAFFFGRGVQWPVRLQIFPVLSASYTADRRYYQLPSLRINLYFVQKKTDRLQCFTLSPYRQAAAGANFSKQPQLFS